MPSLSFMDVRAIAFLTAFTLLETACSRSAPPTWDAGSGASASVSPLPLPLPLPTATVSAAPSTSVSASASSATATPEAGVDPATLPQTRDKPQASGAAFDARVAALWQAIVDDDPDRAMPFFFPLGAYQQVKAIAEPERDWKRRLVAAYVRDIHALHASLGASASRAAFARIDVPEARGRWVEPGEEYNKIGYYRVFGTKLVYTVDQKERTIEITSLISWRGEWYVVHLSGIK